MNTSLLILKAVAIGTGMLVLGQKKKQRRPAQTEDNTQSAVGLVYYYKINPQKAAKRFEGVGMYVSGLIDEVGQDSANRTYLTLQAGKDELRHVLCYLTNPDAAAQLQPGQSVVVWGTCQGLRLNVLLTHCEIANLAL